MALPVWLAVIVQVPASNPVTVFPVTEQTVGVALLLKKTTKPDVALALASVVAPTFKMVGSKLIAPIA